MFYIFNGTVLKPMAMKRERHTKKTIDKMKQSRFKMRFVVYVDHPMSSEQKLWDKRLNAEHQKHELN